MAKNQGKNGEHKSQVLRELPLACKEEAAAVEFLEAQLWAGSPVCPHCTSGLVYQMRDRATGERSKRFLWRCKGMKLDGTRCGKQFTVRVGTVFEDSKIPLRHWAFAFWMACASKKGVSAMQIKRETGLSYESALFMMHRIRWAMADAPKSQPKLRGTVEVDETYVGGKPRNPGEGQATKSERKTAVVALIQRDGSARAWPMPRVTGANVRRAIQGNVDPSAALMTDESSVYVGLNAHFEGGHQTVNHSHREYARGNVHSNSVESFFALLKRGVYGTFHSVSKEHLHRYVSEFAFRWTTRKLEDGQRVTLAIKRSQGKRLSYRRLAGGSA